LPTNPCSGYGHANFPRDPTWEPYRHRVKNINLIAKAEFELHLI
jgi:hypothetical protein